MSKPNRGKNVKRTEKEIWRGTCPICKRTGVKLLWKKDNKRVCKRCEG